jgi:hypothetical protein
MAAETSEKMSQDEIDSLMKNILSGEIDDPAALLSVNDEAGGRIKYHAVTAALSRYEFALENHKSFAEIREARKYLHHAAFQLWLFKHGLTKIEYYKLINRELVKRGRPPFFAG